MKRWEYRNIHLLLSPVYVRMAGWCLRHGVTPFGLLKADWALDHGGATFASKYEIQQKFPQERFPATLFLDSSRTREERRTRLNRFIDECGFPIIVKPDLGRIGYGVTVLRTHRETQRFIESLELDYLAQDYLPGPLEFGVFYIRQRGRPDIFSINSKQFPGVTGTGEHTVRQLIREDPRLAGFEALFAKTVLEHTPEAREELQLSHVGSHTLGCTFRDVTHLTTPELIEAVHEAVGIPGFHYGRLDVRTSSVEALQAGEFQVIEVNGVESLATNAFDPRFSYRDGLRWFMKQYRLLVEIAAEHQHVEMDLLPFREFVRRVRQAEGSIGQIGSMVDFLDNS